RCWLESSSNSIHLGGKAACPPGSSLCTAPSCGRLWCHRCFRYSSASSFGSLRPKGCLTRQGLATDLRAQTGFILITSTGVSRNSTHCKKAERESSGLDMIYYPPAQKQGEGVIDEKL